ncbi:MAG: cyclomaltodextrinase N-terminal domain-containing protein, partial [Terriglobales bacterium]
MPVLAMPVASMKDKRTFALSLLIVCLMALPARAQTRAADARQPSGVAAQSPIVSKIEPPNWWANYTPKLMVLLTGENLNSARVESLTAGISVVSAKSATDGHYLFANLQFASQLQAGTAELR